MRGEENVTPPPPLIFNGFLCQWRITSCSSIPTPIALLLLLLSGNGNGNSIISNNMNMNISISPSSPRLPNSLISHNTINGHPQYSKNKIMINSSFQLLSTTSKLACIQSSSSGSSLLAAQPTSVTNGWEAFASKVSGEWDGFGAEFTEQGKPIELPECVVPEAYREWEVKVLDWQTQCPTLAAHSSPHFSFNYKFIRLLPTVGCEADAATRYSVDHRNITTCTAFAYHPSSGSYVAAWEEDNTLLELEHCLINPHDKESRVRIIQVLRLLRGNNDEQKMELQSVKVFREQWYGPFRDGDQLGGCAIRDSAFASTPPLDASQLIGVWEASIATATFPKNGAIQEVVHDNNDCTTVRDCKANLVLLPKQLWCCLKDTQVSGETCCEAGWLLDKGNAITSNCIFSKTGDLKQVAIAYEHATSELVLQ